MSFGTRLKERREALGLKQSDLGKLLGVTGSAIGNYENGYSSPRADILYRAFDVLQCDANYLFQDEMSETPDTPYDVLVMRLLDSFYKLNSEGKEKVMNYTDDLLASGKYEKDF